MPWEYLVAGSGGPLGIALGGAVTSAVKRFISFTIGFHNHGEGLLVLS